MSEHTAETVIANQAETIRRLIAERDYWREIAELRYKKIACFERIIRNLEAKGGAQ